jgi:tungstate transport system ATP-binding protein
LVGPIDLRVEQGGASVVMGPNGSGKTTFLRLLHGTARLTGGTIDWACPVTEARAHLAFVFQRPVMLRRSVVDNIAYPLRIKGVPKAQARAQAAAWAHDIGLGDMQDRPATSLSGGEQQKLALARAMITAPKVLFLDEPTASLDGRATREIEGILHTAKQGGTKLILSTHDFGQARRLADDVVFLMHGKVHEQGKASAFFEAPQTAQAAAFLTGDIVE